jgi:TonB family protein
MKRILAALVAALLVVSVAGAQTNVQTPTPAAQGDVKIQPPDPTQAAEINRLNAQVVKLFQQNKLEEALPLAQKALELSERTYGTQHLSIIGALKNLAVIYIEKEKYDAAEALYKRALAIYELTSGVDSPVTGEVLHLLGALRFRKGDYDKAEAYFQHGVAVQEKAFGAEDMNVALPVFRLAEFYMMRGEGKKAEPLYLRALALWEKRPQPNKARIVRALEHYYCLLTSTDRKDDAMAAWKRLSVAENDFKEFAADKELVEGDVINGKALSKPQPGYPEKARLARVSGAVTIKIVVNEQGKVVEARAICGHPLLMGVSEAAARAARFSPTLFKGKPIMVTGVITYKFVLQ